VESFRLLLDTGPRDAEWVLECEGPLLSLTAPDGFKVIAAEPAHRVINLRSLLGENAICLVSEHGSRIFRKNRAAIAAIRHSVKAALAEDAAFRAELGRESRQDVWAGLAMFLVAGGLFASYCWWAATSGDPPPGTWLAWVFRWLGPFFGALLCVLLVFAAVGPWIAYTGLRQRSLVRQAEQVAVERNRGDPSSTPDPTRINASQEHEPASGSVRRTGTFNDREQEESSGLIAWYSRRPKWIQILLAPVILLLVPVVLLVMLVSAVVSMAVVFGTVIPFLAVKWWLQNRRYWQRLRADGRVARWVDIEPGVAAGSCTLVVEIGPKGPGSAWVIERPRSAIDPEAIVPTLATYELIGFDLFERPGWERRREWAETQLRPLEPTARVLIPSSSQLARLPQEAKSGSVLAIFEWEGGFSDGT
jgi:hypothetical protein